MAWNTPTLEIGGVVIDVPKALSLSQTYERLGGMARHRMASGTMVAQTYWTRLKTSISGEGQVSTGLWGVDWTAQQVLKCATPLSVESSSNVQVIPAARRSDVAVSALAWVGGFPYPTPVSMSTNTATATVVSGATRYTFEYWPQVSVFITPQCTLDRASGKFSWTLTAEEV